MCDEIESSVIPLHSRAHKITRVLQTNHPKAPFTLCYIPVKYRCTRDTEMAVNFDHHTIYNSLHIVILS